MAATVSRVYRRRSLHPDVPARLHAAFTSPQPFHTHCRWQSRRPGHAARAGTHSARVLLPAMRLAGVKAPARGAPASRSTAHRLPPQATVAAIRGLPAVHHASTDAIPLPPCIHCCRHPCALEETGGTAGAWTAGRMGRIASVAATYRRSVAVAACSPCPCTQATVGLACTQHADASTGSSRRRRQQLTAVQLVAGPIVGAADVPGCTPPAS